MNNDENKKCYLTSQNRVALMLFCMVLMQIIASAFITVGGRIISADEITKSSTFMLAENMLMYLLYIGVPILIYPLITKIPIKRYVSFKTHLPKDACAAILLILGVMYFGQVFSWLMTEFFDVFGISVSVASTQNYSGAVDYIILFVSTAVLPAFLEEIMTRGIILGELLPYGKSTAIIFSGMLFGLMHMNPVQLPFACIAGVIIAYFTVESGSMWIGVIAHFLNNALSVAMEIMRNEMSESAYGTASTVIEITIFTLGILAALYIFSRRRSISSPDSVTDKTPLCTVTNEARRIDLSKGLFVNMSALMILYIIYAAVNSLAVVLLANIELPI